MWMGELTFKGLLSVSMMTTGLWGKLEPNSCPVSPSFLFPLCFPHPGILDPSSLHVRPPIVVPLFEDVTPWSLPG